MAAQVLGLFIVLSSLGDDLMGNSTDAQSAGQKEIPPPSARCQWGKGGEIRFPPARTFNPIARSTSDRRKLLLRSGLRLYRST